MSATNQGVMIVPLAIVDIVPINMPVTKINAGIHVATTYFSQCGVIPSMAYQEVLKEAEGLPHHSNIVELWDQAQLKVIEFMYGNELPESFPFLVWKEP